MNTHDLNITRIAKNDPEKLAKIKHNQQFKELLLGAMAANSSNGLVMHSYDAKTFLEQFISQILPEIAEDEARAATEKFKKENDLLEV